MFVICVIVCVCLKQKRGYVFSQRPVFTTMAPQGNVAVVNNRTTAGTNKSLFTMNNKFLVRDCLYEGKLTPLGVMECFFELWVTLYDESNGYK